MKWLICVCLLCACLGAAAQGVRVDEGWVTLREISLEIEPGSPLDFSGFFPEQAAGVKHPVLQDAEGRLTVAGKRQRFLCAPMNLTPPYGGFPDYRTADRYAAQLRKGGYNLARIMHIESTLMTGRKLDFDYDPEQLDRFHYFLAALKREGVYWMLDVMSSENGSYGNVQPHRWVNRHDLKRRIFSDPQAREHWRQQLIRLFGRKNPHTGLSVLQDEALMGLVAVNEGGLQFQSHVGKEIPAGLKPGLARWLLSNRDEVWLKKHWGASAEQIRQGALEFPAPGKRSEQMDDVLAFFDAEQAELAGWFEKQLRGQGYKGLITAFNNMPSTHADRARSNFAWVDMHAYHDEGFGFQRGARIHNTSSIDSGLRYVRTLAAARLAGRVYTASEYGQPFWNEWRREMLAVPAYAALHDWDAICQHASTAMDLTYAHAQGWKQAIQPYAVGLDPVARAVETLAALLYRRGDVKRSEPFVEFVLPGGGQEANARYWGLDDQLTRHALLFRTRTRIEGDARAPAADKPLASLLPGGDSRIERKLSSTLGSVGVGRGADEGLQKRLLALSPKNRSDFAAGLYESVTGELFLDEKARRFDVRTERTVASILPGGAASLGPLRVNALSVPALVALSSLDGLPLQTSRRMLLVLASDALNTDMRFSDTSRRQLEVLGRLPARMPPLQADFSLNVDASDISVTPLSQSGKRLPRIVSAANGFKVAWSEQVGGASIFYLIERKVEN